MKKILIATPMMPPTAGGPATHSKRLYEYFALDSSLEGGAHERKRVAEDVGLFNFEKYKKYPSGVRHLLTFIEFLSLFRKYNLVFALDAFTVALPAVVAGKITGTKVILRVGGDFIYENFLFTKEITFEEFYANFKEYRKQMSWSLYIKYLVQKFVLENCQGIIFNTEWQKDIYLRHYNLPKNVFVIENPVEPIPREIYENEIYENSHKYIFTSITRDIPCKNLTRLKNAFSVLNSSLEGGAHERKRVAEVVELEIKQGTWPQCLKKISMSRAYICASISDISPNQVQEALSLKIPVIISKYTGITKYLQEAGVARVVDPFDEGDIKKAILEMCDDDIYNKYKENLQEFSWPQTWGTLFKKYEQVIVEIN